MPTDPNGDRPANHPVPRPPNPVVVLQRWQDFGAVWHVVSDTSTGLTISLSRCDGGEEVQRITSGDPELRAWLAGRTRSEQ